MQLSENVSINSNSLKISIFFSISTSKCIELRFYEIYWILYLVSGLFNNKVYTEVCLLSSVSDMA